jgi:hypothetical protein
MAEATGRTDEALGSLRRAIESSFRGNAFYMAEQNARELAELMEASPQESAVLGTRKSVPAAVADMRASLEKTLTGNRYYMASNVLDRIGFLATDIAKPAAVRAAAKTSPLNGAKRRSFDDLAAESRARLQEVAQSLGVNTAARAAADEAAAEKPASHRPPVERPDSLTDGELERRSSKPAASAIPDPGKMDKVEAASISASAVPTAGVVEAAPDLRSPDTGSGPAAAAQPKPHNSAAEREAAAPAPHAAAPAHDPAPAATGQKVSQSTAGTVKPKKSIFALWLDILFGTKRS